ncbi:MAG: plasmid stabilization protein [Dehalococcoidia bacterium]|nr:plasmid stabilization protein [Dehalococcoidia bacterium]
MHPDLRTRLAHVFQDLEADPFKPHLRLRALTGALDGLHAVSVTFSYRITLTLRLAAGEIILLDIGTHDKVYR